MTVWSVPLRAELGRGVVRVLFVLYRQLCKHASLRTRRRSLRESSLGMPRRPPRNPSVKIQRHFFQSDYIIYYDRIVRAKSVSHRTRFRGNNHRETATV